jgi:hypothetical protein
LAWKDACLITCSAGTAANARKLQWFLSRACNRPFNMVLRAGRASVPPEPSNHWLNLRHHILLIGAVAFAASAIGGSPVAAELYVVRDATPGNAR